MRQEKMEFGMAVASAGPYANNLNFHRPNALPDAQPTVARQIFD